MLILDLPDPPFGSREYWGHLSQEELEDRKALLATYVLKLSPIYINEHFPIRWLMFSAGYIY